MSFGGHALDMIVRSKLNRGQLHHGREKVKEYRLRTLGANSTTDKPDITLEEFERINSEIKKHEAERKQRMTRLMLFVYAGLVLVAAVAVWLIFK